MRSERWIREINETSDAYCMNGEGSDIVARGASEEEDVSCQSLIPS